MVGEAATKGYGKEIYQDTHYLRLRRPKAHGVNFQA